MSPAQRRPDQKAFILDEAAKLFAAKGYHATGIADISEAVSLGRGALYHHIRSKEQLLFEISTLHVDELIEASEKLIQDDKLTAADKLRGMSRVLMRNISDNLPSWTVFFREVNSITGDYRATVVDRRRSYERQWADVIAEGTASGEFQSVDPVIVKGILGMHNYSYLWLTAEKGRLTPEELADVFSTVFVGGLVAEPALAVDASVR